MASRLAPAASQQAALAFGVLFLLLILVALLAPVYADHVAHTTQNRQRIADTLKIGGKEVQVVSFDGVPTGPTWHGEYFLGADGNGRDVMVRLLYGARNSLFIGIFATLITMFLAVVLGTLAGYFRGATDAVLSRALRRPVGVPRAAPGRRARRGPRHRRAAHRADLDRERLALDPDAHHRRRLHRLPRPAGPRPDARRCARREFVEAARAQGAGPVRIMLGELMPNLLSTILVFFPLILLANAILLEAALSFLGAGVQPPNPSWGDDDRRRAAASSPARRC